MIKIWPDSLDINTAQPMGSFFFVEDLVTYSPESFTIASSLEDADCVMIPQFSNNIWAEYQFDYKKADYIAHLKKKIIFQNDGGGVVKEAWKSSEVGKYIWNDYADLIKVFFSVECYRWHTKHLPPNIHYSPLDFVGYTKMGLGLRQVVPLQSKEQFLNRQLSTHVCMNTYPPTRDKLFELCNENYWPNYTMNTNPTYKPFAHERIGWKQMIEGLLNSKIGFAPDGATAKTERHLFVPSFTCMMKQEDIVEYPFEWIDGYNCLDMIHDFSEGYSRETESEQGQNGHNIRILNKEKTKEKILCYLQKPNELYDIYCNGYENAKKYELPYYYKNHIGETIKKYL